MEIVDIYVFGGLFLTSCLYGSSVICVIIHLYKFFMRPMKTRSFPTKNLAFYCFLLLLFYLSALMTFMNELFYENLFSLSAFSGFFLGYVALAMAFFELIIVLDTCACLIKISFNLPPQIEIQNIKFFVYCLVCTSTSLVCYILWFAYWKKYPDLQPDQSLIYSFYLLFPSTCIFRVSVACVILIFSTFLFVKLAKIDETELRAKFFQHIRLLLLLGGFSAFLIILQLLTPTVSGEHTDISYLSLTAFPFFVNFPKGFTIGLFFTFKKHEFQSICVTRDRTWNHQIRFFVKKNNRFWT